MSERMSLRGARERLGVSDSTIRRMVKRGSLPAELRDGLYGPELWVSLPDVEGLATKRAAQGLLPAPAPPSPDHLTLGELIQWAEGPAVRMAFLNWARTASTITPGTVLPWIREQLGREQGGYGVTRGDERLARELIFCSGEPIKKADWVSRILPIGRLHPRDGRPDRERYPSPPPIKNGRIGRRGLG